MKSDKNIHLRIFSFWVFGVALTAALILGHGAVWRGNTELHTVMEVIATMLALIVGVMALVRYYSKIDTIFLFMGAGFLGTGFLDGFHAIVTSTYFKPMMPSDLPALIPWSWVASRQFLSILMFLSYLAWRREVRLGEDGRISERTIYLGTALFTLASFLFFVFVPLPRAYYPEFFFHRPEEFAPALFFLLALFGYLKKGHWRTDAFEYWLVLSLIVGFVGQAVFMSHSGMLFDFEFDAAHTLKKASYICVLTGLIISMFQSFRREVETGISLRQSEERMTAIVDNISDGIVTIGRDGIVQWMNLAATRIFGYESRDLVGRNIEILTPKPVRREHDSYLLNYLKTGQAKIIGIGREVKGQRRDGSAFPMELEVAELEFENEKLFLGVIKDITERKAADQMKTEFVSTVSHELRTPLTSIRGSLGLISTGAVGQVPAKILHMVELAENNTIRLISLVNDLLDMEKLQSGEMSFRMEKMSLTEMVMLSIDSNKPYSEEYKVSFTVTDTVTDAFIRGDRQRLAQVMANLLSNAAKFSPEGGTVEISLTRHGEKFRVSVSDHGPGVPEAFVHRVFDRFTQADATDTRQKGGTGLGLNISKAIIEKHGGIIDVRSLPEKGAEFFFDLPEYELRRQDQSPSALSDENKRKAKIIEGCRILVIDDDHDVATFLTIMLEQYGAICDTAHSVAEARRKLAAAAYQIITLDMLLPDGSGVSYLQELRKNEATKDIPIIVVSGVANESRAEVLTSVLGIMDWLEKPIDENRLISAIKHGISLSASDHDKILIVEDDPDLTDVLTKLIGDLAEVTVVATVQHATSKLESTRWSLVILDIELPDGSGLELIPRLKYDGYAPTPVIVYSANEVSDEIVRQVDHALVKSRTSNDDLLSIISAMIKKSKETNE